MPLQHCLVYTMRGMLLVRKNKICSFVVFILYALVLVVGSF